MIRRQAAALITCSLFCGCVDSHLSAPDPLLGDVSFETIPASEVPRAVIDSFGREHPAKCPERSSKPLDASIQRSADGSAIYRFKLPSGCEELYQEDGAYIGCLL